MEELNTLAAQVSHDIRSPLAALEMISHDLNNLEEDKKTLVKSAVARIKDIANVLLQKNSLYFRSKTEAKTNISQDKEKDEDLSVELVPSLIDSLLSEKRIQYRTISNIDIKSAIQPENLGLFSRLNTREFKRIISNLVNNAVESFDQIGGGQILVQIKNDAQFIELKVIDTGMGIPPHVLPRLTQKGFTHNKVTGSGLGLFHAKETVSKWGGALHIESKVGEGTQVTLRLPKVEPPMWFVSELKLSHPCRIIIVDDEHSIHQIWNEKTSSLLKDTQPQIEIMHFFQPQELVNFCNSDVYKQFLHRTLFLCDYEFSGTPVTGIDLIESLGISSKAILVTSRFEESTLIQRSQKIGLKILPKGMAIYIPIKIEIG